MTWRRLVLAGVVVAVATSGCATMRGKSGPRGVPIESRPTPTQPETATNTETRKNGNGTKTPAPSTTPPAPGPSVKVGQALTAEQRAEALSRVVADTAEAGAAARRCRGQKLLPDQENVLDATLTMLADTREALRKDELARAESLARKARQLASSLDCP